jgi:hypothetical protein
MANLLKPGDALGLYRRRRIVRLAVASARFTFDPARDDSPALPDQRIDAGGGDGYLIFLRGASLMAQPFDPGRLN